MDRQLSMLDDVLFAGESRIAIKRRGTVTVALTGPSGIFIIQLINVAFGPSLPTNVISFHRLLERVFTLGHRRGWVNSQRESICHGV